jgi:hypothetical protein
VVAVGELVGVGVFLPASSPQKTVAAAVFVEA